MDQYLLGCYPKTGFYPANLCICLWGNIAVKNFNFHSVKKNYGLNKILATHKFVTHAILFDVNKSTIKPQSEDFISQLAEFLKNNPTIRIEIDGYTDSDGDSVTNLKLSQDRANNVTKKLITYGIDTSRLTCKGFGSGAPTQPNATPTEKAKNRRVEFIVL